MNKISKFLIALILTIIASVSTQAQERYATKSKKAIKSFEKAIESYQNRDTKKAFEEVNSALKADDKFIDALFLLADIYADMGNIQEQINTLNKSLEINANYYSLTYLMLAKAEILSSQYDKAKAHLELFLKKKNIDSTYIIEANKKLKTCTFAAEAMKHQVKFEPHNLGSAINTKYDEYWPSLTADEQTLIFTRNQARDTTIDAPRNTWQEDFYMSKKVDGKWQQASNLGAPMNTAGNEGAQSVSADGKTMVFIACDRNDGLGKCDVYISYKNGNKWTTPVNVGAPVNSQHSEKQVSISADARTIYFSSNRPGGKGRYDLWTSSLNAQGNWTEPKNMGDSINTNEDEMSPFIHADNQTLYFSSNGLTGFGGSDLFLSRKKNGKWTTPQNLGYPINTHRDEIGLSINAKGNLAMFSSNRNKVKDLDLFQFELDEVDQPFKTVYVKGTVFDAKTNDKLKAKFELIDIESNEMVYESFSDKLSGEFLVTLPLERNYALNVEADGYLFHSEHFSLKNLADTLTSYAIDIPLSKIKIGETVVLNNIFFERASYKLLPESNVELNKILTFLNQNSKIKIEIGGHTDNEGTAEYNIDLSQNRAKAVVEFLTQHKVPVGRLSFKGYGYSKPIATNDTKEGRARNRRTEFKIESVNGEK